MPRNGPIYVLGPSSAGKSHLCGEVARTLGIIVWDLDAELGVPDLRDWSRVLPWLESVSGNSALVDVGAGTQHACGAELARYLAPRRDRVVLVMDDPEAAFGRNVTAGHRGPNDSRDYLEVEFRQREALYSLAEHVVDYRKVGMDGALPQLLHIVGELLH